MQVSIQPERMAYRWVVKNWTTIRETARRSGLATTLYKTLIAVLKEQNYYLALAGISLPNEASVNMHERCGFSHLTTYKNVGFKLGQWHDVGWWQLEIQNKETIQLQNPAEPIPVPELRKFI